MSKFSVEIAGLQLKFLNRVWRWSDCGVRPDRAATVDLNVVVDPVQADVVLPQVYAVH